MHPSLVDIDECAAKMDDCSVNAMCNDSVIYPGFTCECFAGYRDKNETKPGRM